MRERLAEMSTETEFDDTTSEADTVGLYDPNKIPRFWKRFLRGQSDTEGEDKLSSDERTEEDPTETASEAKEAEEEVAETEEEANASTEE